MLTANVAFSQDYMDKIAQKTCDCLNTIPDTLETDAFNIELGLCMLVAAEPYKKKIKKDYKIDLNKMDEGQGEEFGRIVGMRLAAICPSSLIRVANRRDTKKEEVMEGGNRVEGKVTAIIDDKFVEFSIKDESGKTSKYYWFTFIKANVNLSSDYKTLLDKEVKITFISQEFFDARINEYRSFNVIQKLNVVED